MQVAAIEPDAEPSPYFEPFMRNLLLGAAAGGLVESFNALTEVRAHAQLRAFAYSYHCAAVTSDRKIVVARVTLLRGVGEGFSRPICTVATSRPIAIGIFAVPGLSSLHILSCYAYGITSDLTDPTVLGRLVPKARLQCMSTAPCAHLLARSGKSAERLAASNTHVYSLL